MSPAKSRHSIQLEEDRRSMQGAWLLIGSLSVFFISCIVLFAIYVWLRLRPDAGQLALFQLPQGFVLSTVIMLAVSVLLSMAVQAARTEKHVDLRRYIILSFVLSIAFFVIQGYSLQLLVSRMMAAVESAGPGQTMQSLYAFTFFLVGVHALHVLGGVAGMTFLLFGMYRGAYDHERNFPVRFCALYWHFLDVVWILMLLSFGLAAAISNRTSTSSANDKEVQDTGSVRVLRQGPQPQSQAVVASCQLSPTAQQVESRSSRGSRGCTSASGSVRTQAEPGYELEMT